MFKKKHFCLNTIKYMQTVKCKFGEFGLFSKMPELVPGRMSYVCNMWHTTPLLNPQLSLLKVEKYSRDYTCICFV